MARAGLVVRAEAGDDLTIGGIGAARREADGDRLGGRLDPPVRPAVEYWTTSVAQRTLVNLRRKAAAPGPAAAAPTDEPGLSFFAWLRAATSYLPRPLPRSITPAGTPVEPLEVAAS